MVELRKKSRAQIMDIITNYNQDSNGKGQCTCMCHNGNYYVLNMAKGARGVGNSGGAGYGEGGNIAMGNGEGGSVAMGTGGSNGTVAGGTGTDHREHADQRGLNI